MASLIIAKTRHKPRLMAHDSNPNQTREAKGQHNHSRRSSDTGQRPGDYPKFYNCNEKGHLSYNCPQRALFSNQASAKNRQLQQERAYQRGTINGVYCTDIVVDTGASKTLVRGDLITPDDIVDGEITIQCAHGDAVSYPLAAVKITLDGKDIITHAAVAKSPRSRTSGLGRAGANALGQANNRCWIRWHRQGRHTPEDQCGHTFHDFCDRGYSPGGLGQ